MELAASAHRAVCSQDRVEPPRRWWNFVAGGSRLEICGGYHVRACKICLGGSVALAIFLPEPSLADGACVASADILSALDDHSGQGGKTSFQKFSTQTVKLGEDPA